MRFRFGSFVGVGLFILSLLFLTGCVPGLVSGRVFDQTTGKPIEGATVLIGDKSAKTNANGSYQISGLAKDFLYALKVTAEGYEDYTQTVELDKETGFSVVNVELVPTTSVSSSEQPRASDTPEIPEQEKAKTLPAEAETPPAETETTVYSPGVPLLPDGIVINEFLNIAVVKIERTQQYPGWKFDTTRVWLSFRILKTGRRINYLFVRIEDDRENIYSEKAEGTKITCPTFSGRIYYDSIDTMRLPLGFTWITPFDLEMPKEAPIVKLEIASGTRDGGADKWYALDFRKPSFPEFQEIPGGQELHFGQKLQLNKDLSLQVGRKLQFQGMTRLREITTLRKPYWYKLTLPMTVKNVDYNPKPVMIIVKAQYNDGTLRCAWPRLSRWKSGSEFRVDGLTTKTFGADLLVKYSLFVEQFPTREEFLSIRMLIVMIQSPGSALQRFIRVTPGDITFVKEDDT